MNRNVKIVPLFCCFFFALAQVWAGAKPSHAFHTSLAQITYDAKSKSFEVVIRLFIDDLQTALQKENGNPAIRLDANDKNDPLLEKYVLKHFGMFTKQKQRITQKYVGKEFEVDAVWIYLEVPFEGNPIGSVIQNSMLFEQYNDQVNMVNITYQGQKSTLLFKPDSRQQAISF